LVYNQKDIVLKILENFDGLESEYVESELPAQIEKQSLKSVRWDWKPTWQFEDAIKATIEGFKKYKNDWN
jgi:nucleoside-diphosphate-sugar epimerase